MRLDSFVIITATWHYVVKIEEIDYMSYFRKLTDKKKKEKMRYRMKKEQRSHKLKTNKEIEAVLDKEIAEMRNLKMTAKKISSSIFLVNKDKKVLLVHPSGNYNIHSPYYPPKETVEEGESIYNACLRVLREELSLTPEQIWHDVLIVSNLMEIEFSHKVVHCFLGLFYGNDDDIKLDWENDNYIWCSIPEARKIIRPEYIPVLDMIEKTNKPWLC